MKFLKQILLTTMLLAVLQPCYSVSATGLPRLTGAFQTGGYLHVSYTDLPQHTEARPMALGTTPMVTNWTRLPTLDGIAIYPPGQFYHIMWAPKRLPASDTMGLIDTTKTNPVQPRAVYAKNLHRLTIHLSTNLLGALINQYGYTTNPLVLCDVWCYVTTPDGQMNNVGASEYYDSVITSGELTFAYIIPEEINELQCLTVKLTSTDYKYLQPPLTINVQVHNIEEDGHTPDDGGMTLPGEETQEPPVTTEDPQQPVDDEITLTEGETQEPPVSAEDPQQPVDDEITLTEGETQEPPVATEDPQQPVDEGMTLPEEDTQEPPVTADTIEPTRTPLTPCGLHYQTQTALAIRGSMVIPNKLDPTKLTLVVLPLTPNCDISFFGRAFNNDGRRTILVEESHTDWSRQNAQQITRPLAGRRIPKCIQFQYGAQLRAPGTGGRITEILLQ